MFIERCKQRSLSFSTIQGYVAGIKHFYEYNDIDLKWRRINAHQPVRQKVVDDRAYIHGELKRMIDIADLRDKATTLADGTPVVEWDYYDYFKLLGTETVRELKYLERAIWHPDIERRPGDKERERTIGDFDG
jgi:hypothetical protein